jgi:toxin ParE1/3/4
MGNFIFAPEARLDMLDISERIAEDNALASDQWIEFMEEKFQTLAQAPMMGRSRDDLAPGLRGFPVGRYIIFYRPIEGGIEIARVLYGGRDLPALFQ